MRSSANLRRRESKLIRRRTLLCGVLVALVLATPSLAATRTLYGTVGPGFTITLKDARGTKVRQLKAGAVKLVVRDKAKIHNFRLKGPGVSKWTTLPFVGTKTWTVTLRPGTYSFVCDPHPTMVGSFKVVA